MGSGFGEVPKDASCQERGWICISLIVVELFRSPLSLAIHHYIIPGSKRHLLDLNWNHPITGDQHAFR